MLVADNIKDTLTAAEIFDAKYDALFRIMLLSMNMKKVTPTLWRKEHGQFRSYIPPNDRGHEKTASPYSVII
jgi:hypothetical protein